ncbi:ATP-dependent DNA helicase RecG [candidate division KSB1 bacterium]|nr:ATP-dependent DNA helicase RecG [candidate division KSB1 bacterium]
MSSSATDRSPNILSTAIQYLKGIGEKRAEALNQSGIFTVYDLLYYFPRRYLDRTTMLKMRELKKDQTVTVIGKVAAKGIQGGRGKSRFVIQLTDETGVLSCVWFNQTKYWEKQFMIGEMLAVSGKVGYFAGYQMVHPEYDRLTDDSTDTEDQLINTGSIIPLYPSSEFLKKVGLDTRGLRKVIRPALERFVAEVHDILPETIISHYQLLKLHAALWHIHFPESMHQLHAAQSRLKFDELFYLELMLALRKNRIVHQQKGIEFTYVGERIHKLAEQLPFELTNAQKRVLHEIRADMKKPHPMFRLLQGDVGSGKTIISLITMLIAVENGYQAALMAPTEILAEQHFLTSRTFLQSVGVNVELLIGAQKSAERNAILERLQNGECNIAIGTHALIQDQVVFKNLGVIVIDEQHRFGVLQRASLMEKGISSTQNTPDVLVMTATPIPRTLSLTLYGDLDVSIIDELPQGRKPINTSWRYANKRPQIFDFVKDHLYKGQQAYIVYPLVEESEKLDLQAASESYEELSNGVFANNKLALLHGRMTNDEKDSVMTSFKRGEIDVLVSTTVIEVGVDVPNATIMVVEHAERFGLTQLHQLRGRVGRGTEQSYCILIATPPISDDGMVRLNTMAQTNDGFKISEVDLKLRGPGEFFGTRQHGMPELRIANPLEDMNVLVKAREAAFELINDDPHLLAPQNEMVHHHFKHHYAERMKLIQVG